MKARYGFRIDVELLMFVPGPDWDTKMSYSARFEFDDDLPEQFHKDRALTNRLDEVNVRITRLVDLVPMSVWDEWMEEKYAVWREMGLVE